MDEVEGKSVNWRKQQQRRVRADAIVAHGGTARHDLDLSSDDDSEGPVDGGSGVYLQ